MVKGEGSVCKWGFWNFREVMEGVGRFCYYLVSRFGTFWFVFFCIEVWRMLYMRLAGIVLVFYFVL